MKKMNAYDFKSFPYREGVIGIVRDRNGLYLIVQMLEYGPNQWRFPGGGVEPQDRTAEDALLRELREELGSDKFRIVGESEYVNQYEWPDEIISDRLMKKNQSFRGQRQRQFHVRFSGEHSELKVDPKELRQVKWVPEEELEAHFIFPGQWEQAYKVVNEHRMPR